MLWPLRILAWLHTMACFSHFSPFCILAGIIKQAHLVSTATDRQQTFAQLGTPGDLLFAAYAYMLLWYARLSWRVNGRMCNTLPLHNVHSCPEISCLWRLSCVSLLSSNTLLTIQRWTNCVIYGENAPNNCDWVSWCHSDLTPRWMAPKCSSLARTFSSHILHKVSHKGWTSAFSRSHNQCHHLPVLF